MPDTPYDLQSRLIIPALAPFYRGVAQPMGWLAFRVIVGAVLVIQGWPKALAPMGQAGFMDSLGFHPGWLVSPLLAYTQFAGGVLIILGLFTRPAALANTILLAVTLWFHLNYSYGDALLTPEGIAFLQDNASYLTADGQSRLLKDGGAAFLAQVQQKAEFTSLFWGLSLALIAAFGGGAYSVDRARAREF